jgi:GNAT superfamily N-acetyltransferase
MEKGCIVKILEYNDVDPLKVLYHNQLSLDFPLTPELAAHIRRTDPRPFPCLAVYVVEDDAVLGQVGVFRLPMVSIDGREDVGGVWAVSTHPQHSGFRVASLLLDEAHARMRAVGLRFSTLGTNRNRVAYELYRRHGYEDLHVWATALAPWKAAHQPTRLRAETACAHGYDFVETIFEKIAIDYLGFSWRHMPFIRLRDMVSLEDIWMLWKNEHPVGYALVHSNKTTLNISNLFIKSGINAAEAVAAVAAEKKAPYVQVKISRPADISTLSLSGFTVAHPSWDAFMLKPLVPDITTDDARRLFGIGTDQFLISWLDTT